jgi:uncharacterized membrane protein YkvA (DUF1232 family)
MALPGGLDLTQAISGVTANDVEAVHTQLPGKLSAVQAILEGGRLRRLRNLAGDVRLLFEILTDRSFPVPWKTTAAIVFALGYFILSLDIIPDVVPVFGFLDDALVLAEVAYFLSGDLQRYRAHRAQTAPPARPEAQPPTATGGGPCRNDGNVAPQAA